MLGEANRVSVALAFSGQGVRTRQSPGAAGRVEESAGRVGLRETEAHSQPSRKGMPIILV